MFAGAGVAGEAVIGGERGGESVDDPAENLCLRAD